MEKGPKRPPDNATVLALVVQQRDTLAQTVHNLQIDLWMAHARIKELETAQQPDDDDGVG